MLHQYEKLLLRALQQGAATPAELEHATKLSRDSVSRALYWLREKKAIELTEERRVEYKLEEEGRRFCEQGFPERRLLEKVAKGDVEVSAVTGEEADIGIPWAKRLEWVALAEKDGRRVLQLTDKGREALAKDYAPEAVCKKVGMKAVLDEQDAKILETLLARGRIVSKHEHAEITRVRLTPEGERLAEAELAVQPKEEVNVLTKELLVTGKWREVKLRPYDILAPTERIFPGKKHPLRIVIDRMREIFIEMGFEEMEDNLIESSFWNFDALFQPQDHPARELADTFYLSAPARIPVPTDEKLVERVKKAHEKGWKYRWSQELAEQAILRTHDTAVSPKYMAAIGRGEKKAPARLFSLGRVYRNEATNYKHLAEFHQVGGIIVDEDGTFRDLLGVLKEFFRKLGFNNIRFRPSFFPYTEPSLEVEVFYREKNEWLELGGAGIFRPEVCLPLWGKYPVLAWGASLERPTMLMMGLDDIRIFYRNDLNWLRNTKVGESWV